jgi:hypothetical protein
VALATGSGLGAEGDVVLKMTGSAICTPLLSRSDVLYGMFLALPSIILIKHLVAVYSNEVSFAFPEDSLFNGFSTEVEFSQLPVYLRLHFPLSSGVDSSPSISVQSP